MKFKCKKCDQFVKVAVPAVEKTELPERNEPAPLRKRAPGKTPAVARTAGGTPGKTPAVARATGGTPDKTPADAETAGEVPQPAGGLSAKLARLGLTWPGPLLGNLMLASIGWVLISAAWLVLDPEWLIRVPDLLPLIVTAGLIATMVVLMFLKRRRLGVPIPLTISLILLIALFGLQCVTFFPGASDLPLRGWTLMVDNSSGHKAQVVYPSRDRRPLRVNAIEAPTADMWKVLLVHPTQTISKGEVYELTLRVRAGGTRNISVSVTQSNKPWDGLGMWGEIELTREYQTITQTFTATQSEIDARVVLILGSETPSLEIMEAHLRNSSGVDLLKHVPRS